VFSLPPPVNVVMLLTHNSVFYFFVFLTQPLEYPAAISALQVRLNYG